MQHTNGQREHKARRRAHQDQHGHQQHQLNCRPGVRLPHLHLAVRLVGQLGLVRDGQEQALPELVASQVGPSIVHEQAAKHRQRDAGQGGAQEQQRQHDEQMGEEGGHALLKASRDLGTSRQCQDLQGGGRLLVHRLEQVAVALGLAQLTQLDPISTHAVSALLHTCLHVNQAAHPLECHHGLLLQHRLRVLLLALLASLIAEEA
mmetsp:Transcript_6204/g.16024  ORF Transcript_6204/g.16024 Transcript_6204/m.16024 type:complete len:205 (+) Transcript_6204:213-827(+)